MSFKKFIDKIQSIKNSLRKTPSILIRELLKEKFFEDLIFGLIAERLASTGTDIDGVKLRTDGSIYAESFGGAGSSRFYSPANKKKRNYNHVDLYETGDLLNSATLVVRKNVIIAKYDLKKADGSVYDNFQLSYSSEKSFESKVLSLSKDEIKIVNTHLYQRIIKYYAKIF